MRTNGKWHTPRRFARKSTAAVQRASRTAPPPSPEEEEESSTDSEIIMVEPSSPSSATASQQLTPAFQRSTVIVTQQQASTSSSSHHTARTFSDVGIQTEHHTFTDVSIQTEQDPSLKSQYGIYLQTFNMMKSTLSVAEPTPPSLLHLKMMASIDRHFLSKMSIVTIDPALISYLARCDKNLDQFSSVDRMKMNFMQLEIQRLVFELNALRLSKMIRASARKIGCMLCDEVLTAEVPHFSGQCGHVYCNTCFTGITQRCVNNTCAFDRRSLTDGNTFELKFQFNVNRDAVCSLCLTPFGADDIVALPACGHSFHKVCSMSNTFRCSYCFNAITKSAQNVIFKQI